MRSDGEEPSGYISIDDPQFDRMMSLRDAYRIMERFVMQYCERGDGPVSNLLIDAGLAPDGISGDPAQIYDFLEVAEVVLEEQEREATGDEGG